MSETVIKIENLSKLYRLGQVGTGTLAHDLNRWWAKVRGKEDPYTKIGQVNDRTKQAESDYVWALKDINLEVRHGEVLGIIGRNGAGKSTLLKLVSRITAPTTGEIKAKGRIASLLEVGTGMHQEMTARENIYFQRCDSGHETSGNRSQIRRHRGFCRLRHVCRYAGQTQFFPGMRVRLAVCRGGLFRAGYLIVDESPGSWRRPNSQKKAIGKMKGGVYLRRPYGAVVEP
jgi:lipopolysaccharide transport system ATP-binding protein